MAKKVNTRESVGSVIRAMRQDAGIDTCEMAKRCRLSQAQISRLETGNQGWRLDTLQVVCRALSAKVSDVLTAAGM